MRKTKPALNSLDKTGMLRAFTDEWKDLESTYSVKLEFVVEPSGRTGVIRLALVAFNPTLGHAGLAEAQYQCEYPSAQVESLEAALFRCGVRLERILRDRAAFPSGKA